MPDAREGYQNTAHVVQSRDVLYQHARLYLDVFTFFWRLVSRSYRAALARTEGGNVKIGADYMSCCTVQARGSIFSHFWAGGGGVNKELNSLVLVQKTGRLER